MDSHIITSRAGVPLTVAEAGQGRPALILHGGGGPATVAMIGSHLAATMHVIAPTHPGWNGTERPDWFSGVDDLALTYLQYLQDFGLRDVLVIGSSLGGWIGAEMAVRDQADVITGLILIDAAGVRIDGEPMVDFFALDPRGVAEHSWHDPDRFFIDPTVLPPAQVATQKANMVTMRVLAGDPYMHDPKLLRRLGDVRVPMLGVWGDSDRITTPAYGRAYTAAFARSEFRLVADAGHLPQIEQPAATFALIDAYASGGLDAVGNLD